LKVSATNGLLRCLECLSFTVVFKFKSALPHASVTKNASCLPHCTEEV